MEISTNNTMRERLIIVMDSQIIPANQFPIFIIRNFPKGSTVDIDLTVPLLKKLLAKIPELNINWLLTGAGDMLLYKPIGKLSFFLN